MASFQGADHKRQEEACQEIRAAEALGMGTCHSEEGHWEEKTPEVDASMGDSEVEEEDHTVESEDREAIEGQ